MGLAGKLWAFARGRSCSEIEQKDKQTRCTEASLRNNLIRAVILSHYRWSYPAFVLILAHCVSCPTSSIQISALGIKVFSCCSTSASCTLSKVGLLIVYSTMGICQTKQCQHLINQTLANKVSTKNIFCTQNILLHNRYWTQTGASLVTSLTRIGILLSFRAWQ